MDKEFVSRLKKTFDYAKMSDVARRLDIPHATVRNYYHGRLPAPDVLIKIARQTGVSLNWLLLGTGEMYANASQLSLARILDEKINEIIDQKLAGHGVPPLPARTFVLPAFDIDSAVRSYDDPQRVLSEWLRAEGREYPSDYGIEFFRGWASFTHEQKVSAVRDAKEMFDRVMQNPERRAT